jgi:hypothetical protein
MLAMLGILTGDAVKKLRMLLERLSTGGRSV